MGPFQRSKNGSNYNNILMVSDYFTQWVEAYAIPNQEATTVAVKLIDNMFCRCPLPEQLHSDMGAQFESKVIQAISKLLGINKTHTTSYHPQSDSLVERLNWTILSMLATTLDNHVEEWEDYLSKVCFTYNTSRHASAGFSPFYLMFGCKARIPLDIAVGTPTSEVTNTCEYAQNLWERFEQCFKMVRENLGAAAERQKEYYNCQVHGD